MGMRMRTIDKVGTILVIAWGVLFTLIVDLILLSTVISI